MTCTDASPHKDDDGQPKPREDDDGGDGQSRPHADMDGDDTGRQPCSPGRQQQQQCSRYPLPLQQTIIAQRCIWVGTIAVDNDDDGKGMGFTSTIHRWQPRWTFSIVFVCMCG